MKLIVLASLALAACSDLQGLQQSTCGNGLIEPGEDCDSPLAHCDRCSIVCFDDNECNAITGGGYICGPDLRCHAPAGTFLRTQPIALDVDALRIADVSQPPDGFGDLLAKSSSAVTVAYGAADGVPATRVSVQAPTSQGPVTFAKLDGDNTLDLLVPTPDGIAAFTFGFGTPSPYTFPQLLEGGGGGMTGQPLMAFSLDDDYVAAVGDGPEGLGLIVLFVGDGEETPVAQAPLCGAAPADFTEGRTSIALAGSPTGTHVMFAALLGSGVSSTVCVLAIDAVTGPAQFVVSEVAKLPGFAPQAKPLLAPLNGPAACPSLIAEPVLGANLALLPGQSTTTATKPCRFLAATPLVRRSVAGTVLTSGSPLGSARLGSSDTAAVLTNGVFRYVSGELQQVYISDRVLDRTVETDLNGDGLVDLVAIGAGQKDLDLLYQIVPLPGMYGFLRVRLPTGAPVDRMLTGEFDGNGHFDIAYVENVDQGDRLMIAYGTADRPLDGRLVGTFTNVFSLLSVTLPDSTDPFEVIDDLAVLYQSVAGEQLALLHGSPQRTMQAFYDPFKFGAPGAPSLAATIPGAFGGGRGGHDLLSLGTMIDPTQPASPPVGLMYVTPTAPDGAIAEFGGRCAISPLLAECSGDGITSSGGGANPSLCLSDASYTTWPVAGRDLAIGIDGSGHAITVDPSTFDLCEETLPSAKTFTSWGDKLALSPAAKPRRIRSLDVISSDPPELGITFAPAAGSSAALAALRTCELVNGVANKPCEDPVKLIAEQAGNVICTDLASGRVFPRSRFDTNEAPVKRDLLVVCGLQPDARAVYRISRFADRSTVTMLFDVATASDIEVGDINGDGIDDIVVIDRADTGATATVYVQCTSRNTDQCEQVVAQEGSK